MTTASKAIIFVRIWIPPYQPSRSLDDIWTICICILWCIPVAVSTCLNTWFWIPEEFLKSCILLFWLTHMTHSSYISIPISMTHDWWPCFCSSPTSGVKGTMNRDYHREIWIHKHRRGSETFKFFTSERSDDIRSKFGLRSSGEGGRPAGGQVTQISRDPWIFETILGWRLEFSDRPYQRNELTQVRTFERGEGPSSRQEARKDGSKTSNLSL